MKLTGDITDSFAGQWISISTLVSVTLSEPDGMKNIYLQIKDAADNISAPYPTETLAWDETELDRSPVSGTLALYKVGTTISKGIRSNDPTFDAYCTYSDDAIGNVYYKLTGDLKNPVAEWTKVTPETGTTSWRLSNQTCTDNEGTKTIVLNLKDEGGNESGNITASFVYDTTAPNVEVNNPDYNRISEVHSLRRNSSGTIADKYADEITFTFYIDDGAGQPSTELYQAYKVCAYKDATAAGKGSHADIAIPTTAGSINMSAGGLSTNASITSTIKGTDFHTALGTGNQDGTHVVVAYIQDIGGTWSEAAKFTV